MSALNTIEQELRAMPVLNSDVQIALEHIEAVEKRAVELGEALQLEQAREDDRPAAKVAAIKRLMGTTNELTGKPHSASSAEAVVETDPEYLAHRRAQSNGVVERMRADGKYAAAKLRAKLAVELLGDA